MLETEHDNLRQALTFCLDAPEGAEKGLQLGAAMQHFWATGIYQRRTRAFDRPSVSSRRAGTYKGAWQILLMARGWSAKSKAMLPGPGLSMKKAWQSTGCRSQRASPVILAIWDGGFQSG